MAKQKSAALIHDISGLGKCSLTAAIPVLSAAGVSVGVLPTAVLSTQTGGLNEYTYRDLTDDMRPIMSHWKKIGIKFDAVYSGFLGSPEQTSIVADFIDTFKKDNGSFFLCDPAMADNGKLYDTFDNNFVASMRELCKKADIIVPNLTEAALLLNREYKEPPYDKSFIENLLKSLSSELSVPNVVLTGVTFDNNLLGAAAYDEKSDIITYSLRDRISGMFHSTGDLFASSLLGGILNGFSINKSCDIAINFTVSAINQTVADGGDSRFGLNFESRLPFYMKELELI
ncbi:MAG: pyridoxamine kinase [Clostridiales bacterium]|nr:pyridoxamine kinase [Clostridiales bacterium]